MDASAHRLGRRHRDVLRDPAHRNQPVRTVYENITSPIKYCVKLADIMVACKAQNVGIVVLWRGFATQQGAIIAAKKCSGLIGGVIQEENDETAA